MTIWKVEVTVPQLGDMELEFIFLNKPSAEDKQSALNDSFDRMGIKRVGIGYQVTRQKVLDAQPCKVEVIDNEGDHANPI